MTTATSNSAPTTGPSVRLVAGGSGDGGEVVGAGATVVLPSGLPHTWQVISEQARFLTINAGRRHSPSFDRFVSALGQPTDPGELPAPVDIDPGRVAQICAENGITVLGPPPPPLG